MNGLLLVARRELGSFTNSLWGYGIVAAILVIDGLLFNAFALGNTPRLSSEVLRQFFYFSFGTTLIASVFLTMRVVAEERQTGTMQLLESSPLEEWQLVVGKWLSAMGVLGVLTLLTAYMPALIFINGKVAVGHIVAGYVGLLLVGSAATAIGTFGSALARSQLVAAVISAALITFFVIVWLLAKITDPPLATVFTYLAFFDQHFSPFMKGRINTEDIVFFVTTTTGFLLLATRWLSARRWR
ncbi:MAG: ABC transporter permease subunit [Nannocystaceae bacterium]